MHESDSRDWRVAGDLVGSLQVLCDAAQLSDAESDVFVRHELGVSTAEIAASTERAESTVRVLLSRARRKVAQHWPFHRR